MRVNRALEKLRDLLAKRRGIAYSGTVLGGALSEGAVQTAPATVVQSIQRAVLAAIQTGEVTSLGSKLLSLMAKSKLATAAIVAAAIAVTTGVALQLHKPAASNAPSSDPIEASPRTPEAPVVAALGNADSAHALVAPDVNPALTDLVANLRRVLHEAPF